ncbi:hypothetical protein O181_106563 [Austropuccinia psidii MF-1]|uniref:Uncharacterized protein n=1 Tax=Austropuccinia psidii MF-1 TaxID=1389203 RepID=A0A9Q3JQY1_9BASI|nr:hypothetical protein [Austropuccinia psidii MF-1]
MPTLMHELTSASPPTILMLLQHPQDDNTMLRPISALTTPYTSTTPPHLLCHLQSLLSHSTLNPLMPPPTHPLPSLCLHSALPTCLQCHPQTGLIINATYHPYPLQHPQDENTMLPPHLCPHHF